MLRFYYIVWFVILLQHSCKTYLGMPVHHCLLWLPQNCHLPVSKCLGFEVSLLWLKREDHCLSKCLGKLLRLLIPLRYRSDSLYNPPPQNYVSKPLNQFPAASRLSSYRFRKCLGWNLRWRPLDSNQYGFSVNLLY